MPNTNLRGTKVCVKRIPCTNIYTQHNITICNYVADYSGYLTVRNINNDLPAVFKGELFNAPRIGDCEKMFIQCNLFSLIIERNSVRLTLRFEFPSEEKDCTPVEWADYFRMLAMFKEKMGLIEIKTSMLPNTLEISIPSDVQYVENDVENPYDPMYCIKLFEGLSSILRIAGVRPEPVFKFTKIVTCGNKIIALAAMIDGIQPVITTRKNASAEAQSPIPSGKLIVATAFRVDVMLVAFYATVNAEIDASNEKVNEAYNDFQFKKVRIIGDSKTAFEEFIVNAQSTEGIDNVLLI